MLHIIIQAVLVTLDGPYSESESDLTNTSLVVYINLEDVFSCAEFITRNHSKVFSDFSSEARVTTVYI